MDKKEFNSEHLSFLGKKYPNCVIIGDININSIRNKLDHLIAITKGNIDVLMILEAKLDESFLSMLFNIDGYNFFRSIRNVNEDGVLVYTQEVIPCNLIPMRNSIIESFFMEMKLRKKKWIFWCSYNTHWKFIFILLIDIGKNLDLLSSNYDNILL